MKHYLLVCLLFISAFFSQAQETTIQKTSIPAEQHYKFSPVIDLETSSVKNQGNTGTCWSFSTSSFAESEIYKNTQQDIDISEMFTVRKTYEDKAWDYVMRQGKTQFSQGGLSHDVINAIKKNGLVPESAFSGVLGTDKKYNHSKIVPALKEVLDAYIKNGKDSKYPNWKQSVDSILDIYIGKAPEHFMYNGVDYTPKSFLAMTKFNPNNYITLTSFTQEPFYSTFILNIPDNFSNGSFYNLPLDELIEVTDNAIHKGYTIALDIDVSEKTFSQKYGLAVLPQKIEDNEKAMTYIVKENNVTQQYRQEEFENFNTTDDHLMQIVGLVKDQNGTQYYKVKNSWGTTGDRIGNGGFIYISKAYFKLKAISVLVNKNSLPKNLSEILEKPSKS
ncbi:C1 family peptidase [Yeosuana marina]|uniref:C1 family peptidase n=1 Tax=Yeosuana marina TaxID=1565536 RepID=UPI0030EB23A6|tara:strand:- start:4868 stop:6037 length:1170 start_codon:yes stop_codon:yes gene_type:complete